MRRRRPFGAERSIAVNPKTRQILVAIDGSQPSLWAVTTGANLAVQTGAAVTLLHVLVPPPTGASEIALTVDEFVDRSKDEGTRALAIARRRVPATVPIRTVLRDGYAAQEIVAQARETGADLIVMGSRGRGRWTHFILGSIAESVIRDAPCPVVSVSHDPGPPSPLPLQAAETAIATERAASPGKAP
jgi:nucleotide-binding universal stress UspA family protein